jgi:hypothetical protein
VQECLDLLYLKRRKGMRNSEEAETDIKRVEDTARKIMEIIKEDEEGRSSGEVPSSGEATLPPIMDKMQINDGENRDNDVDEQIAAVDSSDDDEMVIFDSEVEAVGDRGTSPIQSSKIPWQIEGYMLDKQDKDTKRSREHGQGGEATYGQEPTVAKTRSESISTSTLKGCRGHRCKSQWPHSDLFHNRCSILPLTPDIAYDMFARHDFRRFANAFQSSDPVAPAP